MAQNHVNPEHEANVAAASVARFLMDLFDKGMAEMEAITEPNAKMKAAVALALLAQQLDRMLIIKHYTDGEYLTCPACLHSMSSDTTSH